jgi:glycine hydroxymethyltransferase
VNFSGKWYNFVPYMLDPDTERIDYDNVAKLAKEHKPKLITVGASAYPRDIDFKRFREIADSVGAYLFADIAHTAGLIAKDLLNTPVPYADVVATTTHKTLRGPRGGMILLGKDVENKFGVVAPKSGRTKRMGELIDSWVMPGMQGGPLMHIIAAKAVAFGECLEDSFRDYGERVIANAKALAEELLSRGYKLISGGTDNHLMLVDLRNKGVSGKEAEEALDSASITCNKNSVPNDDKSPLVTSGIRLGTPAMTTRGMGTSDMKRIGEFIDRVVQNTKNEDELEKIGQEVKEFTASFPLHKK